jgi:hypothetical protein
MFSLPRSRQQPWLERWKFLSEEQFAPELPTLRNYISLSLFKKQSAVELPKPVQEVTCAGNINELSQTCERRGEVHSGEPWQFKP